MTDKDFIDLARGSNKTNAILLNKAIEKKKAEYRAELKPFCERALKDHVRNKGDQIVRLLQSKSTANTDVEINTKIVYDDWDQFGDTSRFELLGVNERKKSINVGGNTENVTECYNYDWKDTPTGYGFTEAYTPKEHATVQKRLKAKKGSQPADTTPEE